MHDYELLLGPCACMTQPVFPYLVSSSCKPSAGPEADVLVLYLRISDVGGKKINSKKENDGLMAGMYQSRWIPNSWIRNLNSHR